MLSVGGCGGRVSLSTVPILEPNLHRTLRHVDFLRYPLADRSSGGRVFIELDLEEDQLFLRGSLTLLVLLLLRQRTLPRRATRRIGSCDGGRGR